MDYKDIFLLFLAFVILVLFGCMISNSNRIDELENKVNGNCVYINNEFYCKD